MAQHYIMCSKNPQNNLMVECAHCGTRTMTMSRLQQHMVTCSEYMGWKLKKSDYKETTPVSTMENQLKRRVTVVYDSKC